MLEIQTLYKTVNVIARFLCFCVCFFFLFVVFVVVVVFVLKQTVGMSTRFVHTVITYSNLRR